MKFWHWIIAWALGTAIGLAAHSQAAKAAPPDLQGSWLSPCYSQGGRYLNKDVYIVSSQIFSTESLYADSGCLALSVKLERVDAYESEPLSDAMAVNLTAQRSFMTVFDSGLVTTWNQTRFCGFSDWDVGIPREVTGRDCGGHAILKAGDKDFDLYLRDGYSRLWIGLRTPALDGSTPEKRPHDVDRTVSFRLLSE